MDLASTQIARLLQLESNQKGEQVIVKPGQIEILQAPKLNSIGNLNIISQQNKQILATNTQLTNQIISQIAQQTNNNINVNNHPLTNQNPQVQFQTTINTASVQRNNPNKYEYHE